MGAVEDIRAVVFDECEHLVVIRAHIAVGGFTPSGAEISIPGCLDVAFAIGDVRSGFI